MRQVVVDGKGGSELMPYVNFRIEIEALNGIVRLIQYRILVLVWLLPQFFSLVPAFASSLPAGRRSVI